MNTEQLKTFLCLAETKNFTNAAKQLLISQSTVSKRIQELEREIDQKLFIRNHGNVRLSRQGSSFWQYARQIINMEERAVAQMERTNQFADYLDLGVAYAYYELYLCHILPDFLEQHPEVAIRIRSGHTSTLLRQLQQSMIDIAYVHHPFSHPEYECQCVAEDDLVLVTDSKNQELYKSISHVDVRNLPLIHSNFLYASTYHWLLPKNHQFQLETDLVSDALPLLKHHTWCAFFPRKMVSRLLTDSELVEIPVADRSLPLVRYYAVYHKDLLKQRAGKDWLTFANICSASTD